MFEFLDLTDLSSTSGPATIKALCKRASDPAGDGSVPACAGVCVYAHHLPLVVSQLAGKAPKSVVVAGGFPHGLSSPLSKTREIEDCVAAGAEEIDIVFNRANFLSGQETAALTDLKLQREAAGDAYLKIILEICELGDSETIRRASELALQAGADFLKTSTGKSTSGASLSGSRPMLEAIRDHAQKTGQAVGFKAAGGVRTREEGQAYLDLVNEILGEKWMNADRFRLGASSLLQSLLDSR
ncbi:MAG: deoxyribose-phosphate aldolase [Verrucomicrobiota bacterium]